MGKYKSRATRLSEALDGIRDGLSEIESLQEEVDNWKEGMEGTNLEQTDKYQMLTEASDALSSGHDDIENALSELENVEFPTMYS